MPNGMTGTLYSLARRTASLTSCVLSANTTALGGGTGANADSSPMLLPHHQRGGAALGKTGLEGVHQGDGQLALMNLGREVRRRVGRVHGQCLLKMGHYPAITAMAVLLPTRLRTKLECTPVTPSMRVIWLSSRAW